MNTNAKRSGRPPDNHPHPDTIRMLELLGGDEHEHFHGIPKGKGKPRHVCGDLKDPKVAETLRKWNGDGCEIYVSAQLVAEEVTSNPKNENIEAGRVLFVDSDGKPMPDTWHIEPTFLLKREDDPEHSWWAFWVIDEDSGADEIKRYQRRLAAQYGTDPSVCDARRIVRLPGYTRWPDSKKKANRSEEKTTYRLKELSGKETSLKAHNQKLVEALPEPNETSERKTASREKIPEAFLREVLLGEKHINPNRQRNDGWLQVLGAVIDADVIREDGSSMPYDEKVELLREWSMDGATYDEEKFEDDCEWLVKHADEERDRAGAGTIYNLAKKDGYEGPPPSAMLSTSEAFTKETTAWTDEWPEPSTMADIMHAAPPRQWAIGKEGDGYVPQGEVTLLYGRGGSGKTLLAAQMALSAGRGEKLFGAIPCKQMPAFLVACEDDHEELHRRFEKLGRRAEDTVRFVSLVGRDTRLNSRPNDRKDTKMFGYIDEQLKALGDGPKLLVIDNLFQVYKGDYVDASAVASFLNEFCRRIAFQNNATVIVLAHPSQSQKQSGEGGYGGVGWDGGVRSRLSFDYLTNDKGAKISDTRVFGRKKSNYAPVHDLNDGVHVVWDDWKFRLAEDDDVKIGRRSKDYAEAEAVLRYIHENDFREGFSLAANLQSSQRKLVSKPITCNLGNGSYTLTAAKIKSACELLLKIGLLSDGKNSKGSPALRPTNPEKSYSTVSPFLVAADELEDLCEKHLAPGRKPPRSGFEPSEPVETRKPRRRTRNKPDPFEQPAQGKRERKTPRKARGKQ